MRDDYITWLASEFKDVPLWVQLLKLSEECGEVAEAFIGATGANPRKGYCRSHADVRGELLDVAITALVAFTNYHYGSEEERDTSRRPIQMLDEKVRSCLARQLSARGISDKTIAEMGVLEEGSLDAR